MRQQIAEVRKLAELRALTDRQLTALISNRLERGFALAERLGFGAVEHDREVTRLVLEIRMLLPAVNRADRVCLQSQLAQLEEVMMYGISMQTAS